MRLIRCGLDKNKKKKRTMRALHAFVEIHSVVMRHRKLENTKTRGKQDHTLSR